MIINMPTVSMGSDGSLITADRVAYDNDTSGLSAENVQDALDELNIHQTVEYQTTLPSGYVWYSPTIQADAVFRIVRLGNLRVSQPCLVAVNANTGTQFNSYVKIPVVTIDPIDRPTKTLWANVWTYQNSAIDPSFFDYYIDSNGEVSIRSRVDNRNLAWIPSFVWTVD